MAAALSPDTGGARFCYLFAAPLVAAGRRGQWAAIAKPLNLAQEQQALKETLGKTGKAVLWERHVAVHSTFADALQHKVDVLHYSGHGEKGYLCGEGDCGELCPIKAEQVAGYFSALGKADYAPPLVFVAACHSEQVGAVFMQAGSPHVVCVNVAEEVNDQAAIVFSKSFYSALLDNVDVASAFLKARQVVLGQHHQAEADKFLLLPEPKDVKRGSAEWEAGLRQRHGGASMAHVVPGELTVRGDAFHGGVPDQGHLFGRDGDIHAVYQALTRSTHPSHFVSISGPSGVGKGALATAVAAYAADRTEVNSFRRVLFLDVQDLGRAVERPHSPSAHGLAPPDLGTDVAAEMLAVWGVPDARRLASASQYEQRAALAAVAERCLLVVTHVHTSEHVSAATLAAVEGVLEALAVNLVKNHHAALVVAARDRVGERWGVSSPTFYQLAPLAPEAAAALLLTQWQIRNPAPAGHASAAGLQVADWGSMYSKAAFAACPKPGASARDRYFFAVSKTPIVGGLQGNPQAILRWLSAAAGRKPAAHAGPLLQAVARTLLDLGLEPDAGVLGADVVAAARAAAGAGGGTTAVAPTPLPEPPGQGAGGSGGLGSPLPPFTPGGRSPRFSLTVSRSDVDMVGDQTRLDATELWSAICTHCRGRSDSVALPAPVPGGAAPAGSPAALMAAVLPELLREYVHARLPRAMAVRPIGPGDVAVLVDWLLQFVSTDPRTGQRVLTAGSVTNCVQSMLLPWLWMLKARGTQFWLATPASQAPRLLGFLDKDAALSLLREAGAPMGSFLLRFSQGSPHSITFTVLCANGSGQVGAWNCRLKLAVVGPGGGTAYTADGGSLAVAAGSVRWEYSWPHMTGPQHALDLGAFLARHSDVFKVPFSGPSNSTYDDGKFGPPGAAGGALPARAPALSTATTGGVPSGPSGGFSLHRSAVSSMAGLSAGTGTPPAGIARAVSSFVPGGAAPAEALGRGPRGAHMVHSASAGSASGGGPARPPAFL